MTLDVHEVTDAAPGKLAVPSHLACIMDGNGRWATRRDLERIAGHDAGEAAVLSTIEGALTAGVEWLTLYAFSTENWDRPQAEVDFLMRFNQRLIVEHGPSFHEQGLRVRYLGEPDGRIPASVAEDMRDIQELTRGNRRMNLTFAFNYGGRAAITAAVRHLVADGVQAADVDEAAIARRLQHAEIPDPDLIVRTSGELRLSNFLLWGSAYAELLFVDVLWPDFRARHLNAAIDEFGRRKRKYGRLEVLSLPPSSETAV